MKARPILFNTDMVKAILAGHKTQTRRALKDQPPENMDKALRTGVGSFDAVRRSGMFRFADNKTGAMWPEGPIICAHGQPGDLLYVRETFAILDENSVWDGAPVYRASDPCAADRWTPSIHMPRWASRLTLEITDVRVERLQDIGGHGEAAEGLDFLIEDPITVAGQAFNEAEHYAIAGASLANSPERFGVIAHFRSIGIDWDANPWVWVVEFKVHHCNVDALLREREAA